jgi:hypothetical protein
MRPDCDASLCRPSYQNPAFNRTTNRVLITTSAKSVVIALTIDGDGLWENTEEGHHPCRPCQDSQEASRAFHPSTTTRHPVLKLRVKHLSLTHAAACTRTDRLAVRRAYANANNFITNP